MLLNACGNSSPVGGDQNYPNTVVGANQTLAPDGQGKPCQTGLGRIYNVSIPSPFSIPSPLRGLGHHSIDLSGVATRLQIGDQLGLMLFGANTNQYPTAALKINPAGATHVSVQGSVQMPLLGDLPQAQAP